MPGIMRNAEIKKIAISQKLEPIQQNQCQIQNLRPEINLNPLKHRWHLKNNFFVVWRNHCFLLAFDLKLWQFDKCAQTRLD